MEVDGTTFSHHLLGLFIHISEADFVSFDLELSGIPSRLPNKKPRGAGRLTLEDRYAETKEGADRYQILQVGLTCAKFDYIDNKYVLRPYNINISPLLDERLDFEREISFQSGACTFLLNNGFDLGAPFAKGVQYLSREEAARAKQLAYDRIDKKNPIEDLQLKDSDVKSLDFVRRAREAITKWQKSTSTSLEITTSTGLKDTPPVYSISRFEKRLVHQLVRAEFPTAVAIGRAECIRIVDFDPVREADNTRRIKNRVKEQIARQTGFRWVFEALVRGEIDHDALYIARSAAGVDGRDRFDRAVSRLKSTRPVLVGHNMFTDIVYLYRTFVGPLPDTLHEFSLLLHDLFPRIIDTKYLATHAEGDLNASPTLEEIAKGLQAQPLPNIVTHEDYGKYNDTEAFHEAGYDSLLTATIMLRLAAKLGSERSPQIKDAEQVHRDSNSSPDTGGVAIPPDFLTDGREKVSQPVPVPRLEFKSSTKSKKARDRKKKKNSLQPAATSTARRFETKNVFDSLLALSLDDTETSISKSSDSSTSADGDGEEELDHNTLATNWSTNNATEANGSWADDLYVQDKSGWVPIPRVERRRMEMIPAFGGGDVDSHKSAERVDDGNGETFWSEFGNTLRVFGTEEKVWRIADWPDNN